MSPRIFEEQQGGPLKNNDAVPARKQKPGTLPLKGKRKGHHRTGIDHIIHSATVAVHNRHSANHSLNNDGVNLSY